jgi:hypothetical protein
VYYSFRHDAFSRESGTLVVMRLGDEELAGAIIVLAFIGAGFAVWLAVSAYSIHEEEYKSMMAILQSNYHWCMLYHTEAQDNKYPECMDQFDVGFKSLYQGWWTCYQLAFYDNWFIEKIKWGF